MIREELVKKLADVLSEDPSSVSEETELESLSDWDSMGQMEVISILDSIQVSAKQGALEECRVIGDIVALAGLDR